MPQRKIHIFGKQGCTGCAELTPQLRKLAKKYKLKFSEWDVDTMDALAEGAFIGLWTSRPLPQIFVTVPDKKESGGCLTLFDSNKVERTILMEKLTAFLEGEK